MATRQNENNMPAEPRGGRGSSVDDRDRPHREDDEIRGVGDSGESDEEFEEVDDLEAEDEDEDEGIY